MKIRKIVQSFTIPTSENRAHLTPLVVATTVALFLWAQASSADWLVMKDGSRIETQGAWKVQGTLILFEIQGGTLASIRRRDVDLDASRQVTTEAESASETRSRPVTPVPKKKAILVLTDADVSHPKASSASSEREATGEGTDAIPPNGDVTVTSWNTSDLSNGNGIRIVGSVRNSSGNVVADLSIAILAYDSTGELLLSAPAILGAQALQPGQATSLAGELVGVFSYARVDFDVDYFPLEKSAEAEPATSTQRPDNG